MASDKIRIKRRLIAVAALVGVVAFASYEWPVPLLDLTREGDVVYASYWSTMEPRVRLEYLCDDESQSCYVQAFCSYAPWWWFKPNVQERIRLPQRAREYELKVVRQDMTPWERNGWHR